MLSLPGADGFCWLSGDVCCRRGESAKVLNCDFTPDVEDVTVIDGISGIAVPLSDGAAVDVGGLVGHGIVEEEPVMEPIVAVSGIIFKFICVGLTAMAMGNEALRFNECHP